MSIATIKTKTCIKCNTERELFNFRISNKGYIYHKCTICLNEECRGRRKLNPKKPVIKEKSCKVCNVLKTIKRSFPKIENEYSDICIACVNREYLKSNYNRLSYPKHGFGEKISRVFHACRMFDLNKGLDFNLDPEFINNCIKSKCFYCTFPPTGLDRLNNDIGHTKDNCVPCCKECNIARSNSFTVEEMKVIGLAIKEIKLSRILKD